jgi:hypothetical protein
MTTYGRHGGPDVEQATNGVPRIADLPRDTSLADNPSPMPNVFISHRRADVDLAEKLARQVRDAGHAVWFDEWDIGIGDSIAGRMDEGLEGAAYLVLCCSERGVDAPWISREWLSALARQLDGEGVKILPVLLSGTKRPAILADIRYADLRTDWDRGVAQLLKAIR